MNVLTISGDPSFKPGHPRFDLQAGAVEHLEALYWAPGALWATPRGDSFDVVSAQDPFWRGLLGLFWAHHFKACLNVQVHADLAAQSFFKRSIARFVLRRADSVRVVSERLKEQLFHYGCQASVITVLPVFVDVERFRAVQRRADAPLLILWVGRFANEKDPMRALEIFRTVLKQVPDVTMIMLGSGSLREKAQREVADKKLPVEFPGWQDTVLYLARATLVLSTSKAESWGASIVEALAAGVPVVAPDVGIAKEAGAVVVQREHVADAVVKILRTKPHGELKLHILTKTEWMDAWKQSL